MKSRYARLAVLCIPVMALFASLAPPAQAIEVGGGIINGRATVSNGLAYPCFDGKTHPTPPTNINVAKCQIPMVQPTIKTPVTFTFAGQLIGGVVKVAKPKCGGAPACAAVGIFNVNATGTVSGKCGLSAGTGNGTITVSNTPVNTKATNPPRPFGMNFTGVGGNLVIRGAYDTTGTIAGVVVAAPDATVGSSCFNKSAKTFIIVGAVVMVDPN